MDSAKDILRSIIIVTGQVRTSISRYSTARRVRQVRQYSLIQLEIEFQTIDQVARAIIEALDDPSLSNHHMLDARLLDWLSSDEPDTCLDTLRQMERRLGAGHETQGAFQRFTSESPRSEYEEDDVNAAIVLFQGRKAYFYFLWARSIWNNESRQKASYTEAEQGRSSSPVNEIVIGSQRKEIFSQKRKKMVKLLDALDCKRKHHQTSSIRQADTCTWLPATDAYKSWKEGGEPFLWLHGKAGAGKTVLASAVIDDLGNGNNGGRILGYFYCDFRMARSTSAVEVMRSILAQLIAHLSVVEPGSEQVLDELLKDYNGRPDPFYNPKGLACYVSKVARLYPRKSLVVVDALDECKEVESLLDGLTAIIGDVRVFATSRPLQNVKSILAPFPCMSMDKMAIELLADIRLHVTRELDSRHRLRTLDEKLKGEVRAELCTKADGMFRWVQCQIDTLESCNSGSEIRRALESLPEGLEETYRRILIAIDRRSSDACLVRRALVWLVTALRPIHMRELLEAIMIDAEYRMLDSKFGLIQESDLLEACRSLVAHHRETDIISLSHMSVKEYLVGELVAAKLPWYHIILDRTHEHLARLCMAYIVICLQDMMDTYIPRLQRDPRIRASHVSRPLLNYVLSDGFGHLGHLGPEHTGIFRDIQALQKLICQHTREWDQLCQLVPSTRTGIPWLSSKHDFAFYILVAFASELLLESYVLHTAATPQEGTNPLLYCAYFGKIQHTKILLSQGTNVNDLGLVIAISGTDEQDMDDMTIALEVAVDRWHSDMVDFLLTEGSTVPEGLLTRVLKDQPHDFPFPILVRLLHTPKFLEWGVSLSDNQRFVEALLDNAEDYAELDGLVEITLAIKRLTQVSCGQALLISAVERGRIQVIRALLTTNAIVNAVSDNGDTPLHIAMRVSNEDDCLVITKLLVDNGFDPCCLDADDKPPIHIAVVRGFVSIVEYFLSLSVSLPRRILFTALQTTLPRRVEMVRLLINSRANVRVLNTEGDSLLHVAMRSPDRSVRQEITWMLVDAGCYPPAPDLQVNTPFQITAKDWWQEHPEIGDYLLLLCTSSDIKHLLDPDPSSQAKAFRLLLGNADGVRFSQEQEDRLLETFRQFLDDENKHLSMTKMFVDSPGDRHVPCNEDIFNDAVRRGYFRVVEHLLSQNCPLPNKILFTATRHQMSMIPLLVRAGADLHERDNNGDTILHIAIKEMEEPKCLSTTCVIVDAGFHFSFLDGPMHVAASRGFMSVVSYFLSRHVPLPSQIMFTAMESCHRDHKGNTILHRAARVTDEEAACLEITRFVVKAGCDPSQARSNHAGHFPIDIAVNQGFVSVVEYLLSERAPLHHRVLFNAMENDKVSMVPLLIKRGADPHAKTHRGDTLLHAAMQSFEEKESLEGTRILICEADCARYTSTLNQDGHSPIDIAVSRGFTSVVKYLLSQRGTRLPLRILFTALRSEVSMVSFLIDNGADILATEYNGDTLLHVAIGKFEENRCVTTVKLLTNAGCPISTTNVDGISPIEVAVQRGFFSVVKYLLSKRALLPRRILFTALRSTGDSWKAQMIPLLIRRGADLRATEHDGKTLLHVAVQNNSIATIERLVSAGCPISTPDDGGTFPIDIAVTRGLVSVVECFLHKHTPLPRRILFTALRSHRCLDMIPLLIDGGADLRATEDNGDSLLHVAVKTLERIQCQTIIRELIHAGCSPSVSNDAGHFPIDIATSRGFSLVEICLPSQFQNTESSSRRTGNTSTFGQWVSQSVRLLTTAGSRLERGN